MPADLVRFLQDASLMFVVGCVVASSLLHIMRELDNWRSR